MCGFKGAGGKVEVHKFGAHLLLEPNMYHYLLHLVDMVTTHHIFDTHMAFGNMCSHVEAYM
jgi:hypothetical protein